MKLFTSFVVGAMLAGTTVFADVFECSMNDSSNSGWLPEMLAFEYSGGSKTISVYDPITFSSLGKIATANVTVGTAVRISFGWQTGVYRNALARPSRDFQTSGSEKIQYRATFLRGGSKMLLRAYLPGSSEPFSARGSCAASGRSLDQLAR